MYKKQLWYKYMLTHVDLDKPWFMKYLFKYNIDQWIQSDLSRTYFLLLNGTFSMFIVLDLLCVNSRSH